MDNRIIDLMQYLDGSRSVFHAVEGLRTILEDKGYTRLQESGKWSLQPGGKYYMTRGGASIMAFRIPEGTPKGFIMSASHADRPTFKVKENGELCGKYTRLAVERYGGMLMAPWLDRPLSIAGRVLVETDKGMEIKLIDIDRDLLLIPNVAIHMNRKANDGYSWNPAVDLLPLMGGADAMGQLFYSISMAMGIMIAYGSYVGKATDLNKSVNQIELFDTVVAFLAGMMIIPAVFTFMGKEGMTASGPALMFVALPKVFAEMGNVLGTIVGILFFVTVAFAALTSSVSVMEAIVSSVMDKFHMDRKKATLLVASVTAVVGLVVCLGYNALYFEAVLPNTPAGKNAQILDILDYLSNYILMPVVAISTCIFIGWVVKPKTIIDEVTLGGHKFSRQKLYVVIVKFITPVLLTVLLLLQALGLIKA